MNFQEIISLVFELVIIPLLGVVVAYIVAFIKNKTNELKVKVNNEEYSKYIDLATNAIIKAVIETNQTYVNSLKASGSFNKAEQLIAFEKTKATALAIMDEAAKEFLNVAIIDFNRWVESTIESLVVEAKKAE